jgi:hypothetical protein
MNKSHQTGYVNTCVMLTALISYIPCSVVASTIFAPTDGNVNFLFGDLKGGTLAMFDDSDQNYLYASIDIPLASTVGIFGPVNNNNDYLATNSLGDTPLTLTGNNHFILGLNLGGVWLSDTSVVDHGANSYTVNFSNGGSLLMVDTQVIQAVPVPAAAWLFGSGLLGLAGIARRKKNSVIN